MTIALIGIPNAQGVASTSTVVFRTDPTAFTFGDQFLVQATIPVDGKNIPDLYHPDTGERCDMLPVSRDVNGLADMHQLVCRHTVIDPNQNSIEFTTNPVVPKQFPTAQWDSEDFSNLTIQIHTTSSVVFSARLGDAMFRKTWRAGQFVDEREYFIRSTGASGQKGPGVRFFVDRQINRVVNIYFIIENTMWTPSVANLSAPDPDGTGEVFYSKITMANIPTNYFPVQMEIEQPSSNTPAGEIVKPETLPGFTGPEQLMELGSENLYAFTFRHATVTTAKATAIGQFVGYGFPQSGTYNVYTGKGYGASRNYGVDFGAPGIDHEGTAGTGLASTLERDATQIAYLRSQIIGGGGQGAGNPFFNLPRSGSYYPYGPENIRDAGEAGVELFGLGSLHGEGFRIALLRLKHTMQRHSTGLCDPSTGEQVTMEQLVALKGIGLSPWAQNRRTDSLSERWNNELPINLRQGYVDSPEWNTNGASGNSDIRPNRAIAQEGKAWNQPTKLFEGTTADDIPWEMQRRRQSEFKNFSRPHNKGDSDHQARYFGALDPLAYGANLGVAKHLIIKEGIYAQRAVSRYSPDPAFDDMNGPYYKAVCSLQERIDMIVDNSKQNWAGYGDGTGSGTSLNRGSGMIAYCVANGYRFTASGSTYRNNTDAWISKYVEAYDLTVTPYGLGIRHDANSYQANGQDGQDFALQIYPASNDVGATDVGAKSGAFPLDDNIVALPGQTGIVYETGSGYHLSCMQTFQPGYANHGVAALMLAAVQPGSANWTSLRKSVTFVEAMYDTARKPGQMRPPSVFPASMGSAGTADAPDALPTQWYFNPAEFSGAGTRFNPEWDSRALFLMSEAMLIADAEGDAATLAKHYQYLKEFMDIPVGTTQNVIDAVYSPNHWNGESQAQVYQSEYLRSRYGALLGVLNGLRNKGSIAA